MECLLGNGGGDCVCVGEMKGKGGGRGCVLLFVRRVCLLVSEEEVYVCMCVTVLFRGGDQGSPSCKLLEPSQMVNLQSPAREKQQQETQGGLFPCACMYLPAVSCAVWCGH